MEFDQHESIRHQRIHGVVQGGRRSAADGIESGHRNRGAGSGARGILQCGRGHEVERAAPEARLRSTLQREALVSGQRDGRPLADRSNDGRRIWNESEGCGEANALRRQVAVADRLRLERTGHVDVPRMGPRGPGDRATTTSTDFPCIAISKTRLRRPVATARNSSP